MSILPLALLLFPVCLGVTYASTDPFRSDVATCMSKGMTPCRFDPKSREQLCTCIRKDQLCDGTSDCPGGCDELSCRESTILQKAVKCEEHQVRCPGDGRCAAVCDGFTECKYGEDEMSCTICDKGEVTCKKHNGWQGCAKLCDGVPECVNNIDEAECVSTKCKEDEIICRDGHCATLCNNCSDCRNNEDEVDCFNKDVVVQNNICPFGHIGCANGITYDVCDVIGRFARHIGVPVQWINRSQCLQILRQICPLLNFILYAGHYT